MKILLKVIIYFCLSLPIQVSALTQEDERLPKKYKLINQEEDFDKKLVLLRNAIDDSLYRRDARDANRLIAYLNKFEKAYSSKLTWDYKLFLQTVMGALQTIVGKYQKAVDILEQALIKVNKTKNNNLKIRLLAYLGSGYWYLHNEEKSFDYLNEALNLLSDYPISDEDLKFDLFNILGNIHVIRGQYDMAKKYYQRNIMDFNIKSRRGISFLNLGWLHCLTGEYERSLEYSERAVSYIQQSYGRNHPAIAEAIRNKGYVLLKQGKLDQAKLFLEKAYGIRKKYYGTDHMRIAYSLQDFGELSIKLKNYKAAKGYLDKCLNMAIKHAGKDSAYMYRIYISLGDLYFAQGKFGQAKKYYERVFKEYDRYYSNFLPEKAHIMENLEVIKQKTAPKQ